MEITTADNSTIATLNKTEIDQQISTAKKFPRDIASFPQKLTQMAASSEKTAIKCMYALPRDGKTIEGPSARFAEMVAGLYGNCRAGARVVSEDGDFVTAQGVFHDLETNTSITYEVKRRITNKQGQRYSADMIGVTGNAACSIALRNAILKGVPSAFWEAAYDEVREAAMGDAGKLEQRRNDAVKFFKMLKVTEEHICNTLGVDTIDDIDQEKLLTLRGIANAIKEGDTTAEQAFGLQAESGQSEKTASINDNLRKQAEQPAEREEAEESTEEVPPPQPGEQGFTADQLLLMVEKADSQAALDEIIVLNEKHLSGQDKARVTKAINQKLDTMVVASEEFEV